MGRDLNLKLETLGRNTLVPVINCMIIDNLLRSVFKFYV